MPTNLNMILEFANDIRMPAHLLCPSGRYARNYGQDDKSHSQFTIHGHLNQITETLEVFLFHLLDPDEPRSAFVP